MIQIQCNRCLEFKPESAFKMKKSRHEGRRYRQHHCRKCDYISQKKHMIRWQLLNRKKWNELHRKVNKKIVVSLADGYIKKVLKMQGATPTPEKILEKRLSLKLKRKIYEITKQLDTSGNYGRPNVLLPGID